MDLEGIKGDTEFYDFVAKRGANFIDLSGGNVKIWFTAKREKDDLDVDAVISLNNVDDPTQISITDAVGGEYYVRLEPADTANVDEDSLVFDSQVREQDGRITTVTRGKLYLIRDITRTI